MYIYSLELDFSTAAQILGGCWQHKPAPWQNLALANEPEVADE